MAKNRVAPLALLATLAAAPASAPAAKLTSLRTSLAASRCHAVASTAAADAAPRTEGEDAATPRLACDAPAPYRVFVEGAGSPQPELWVEADGGFSVTLSPADVDAFRFGPEIEWRLADGVPFAAILHVTTYSAAGGDEEHLLDPRHVSGERILIKGLKGHESLDALLDARATKTAGKVALGLADREMDAVKTKKH